MDRPPSVAALERRELKDMNYPHEIQTVSSAPGTEKETGKEVLLFRRPEARDETDRIGRELVRRLMEAGVLEP